MLRQNRTFAKTQTCRRTRAVYPMREGAARVRGCRPAARIAAQAPYANARPIKIFCTSLVPS